VFFRLSKILDELFSPLTWSALLIAAGVFWRRAPARGRWIALSGLLLLLLFSLEPVANRLQSSLEQGALRTYRPEVTYDAAIVLGGMVERATAPEQSSYNDSVERLLVAYDLLRANRVRYAILSGGPLDQEGAPAEAEVLARQLVDWGIARERLAVEAHSRNTHENALECKRIADGRGWKRLVLVTSAIHMPRAAGCFRAVGLGVDTLPVDYRAYDASRLSGSWLPRAAHLERSTEALREWFGRAVYLARGYAR
jgi:uncharacterized SAM-binding protein YcdF (DUF218 family)